MHLPTTSEKLNYFLRRNNIWLYSSKSGRPNQRKDLFRTGELLYSSSSRIAVICSHILSCKEGRYSSIPSSLPCNLEIKANTNSTMNIPATSVILSSQLILKSSILYYRSRVGVGYPDSDKIDLRLFEMIQILSLLTLLLKKRSQKDSLDYSKYNWRRWIQNLDCPVLYCTVQYAGKICLSSHLEDLQYVRTNRENSKKKIASTKLSI